MSGLRGPPGGDAGFLCSFFSVLSTIKNSIFDKNTHLSCFLIKKSIFAFLGANFPPGAAWRAKGSGGHEHRRDFADDRRRGVRGGCRVLQGEGVQPPERDRKFVGYVGLIKNVFESFDFFAFPAFLSIFNLYMAIFFFFRYFLIFLTCIFCSYFQKKTSKFENLYFLFCFLPIYCILAYFYLTSTPF